jgi:hypothetical protein
VLVLDGVAEQPARISHPAAASQLTLLVALRAMSPALAP